MTKRPPSVDGGRQSDPATDRDPNDVTGVTTMDAESSVATNSLDCQAVACACARCSVLIYNRSNLFHVERDE